MRCALAGVYGCVRITSESAHPTPSSSRSIPDSLSAREPRESMSRGCRAAHALGRKGGGTLATNQAQTDLQRAELHAREAERLLEGRLGLITNYVKAEAHATLALYYVTHGHADK